MELKKNKSKELTTLHNPAEKARILRQYAGIFPNNIQEYAEKFIPKQKARKDFTR